VDDDDDDDDVVVVDVVGVAVAMWTDEDEVVDE
jgi:hypothetical protein